MVPEPDTIPFIKHQLHPLLLNHVIFRQPWRQHFGHVLAIDHIGLERNGMAQLTVLMAACLHRHVHPPDGFTAQPNQYIALIELRTCTIGLPVRIMILHRCHYPVVQIDFTAKHLIEDAGTAALDRTQLVTRMHHAQCIIVITIRQGPRDRLILWIGLAHHIIEPGRLNLLRNPPPQAMGLLHWRELPVIPNHDQLGPGLIGNTLQLFQTARAQHRRLFQQNNRLAVPRLGFPDWPCLLG